MKKIFMTVSSLIAALGLTACVQDQKNDLASAIKNHDTLVIMAGSELKDMEPILQAVKSKTGVNYMIQYTGTIDGIERLSNGESADIAWFSQGKYVTENTMLNKKVAFSEKIMYSPVVIGVRESSVSKLQIGKNKVTWSQVYDWVDKKSATYAMTDPSTSNTGFVGLTGIAYAKANKGESLRVEDIKTDVMQKFFKGHVVNAGSSGYLMEAFKISQVDFVINYESLILEYNKINEPLKVVIPFEGVVTSDYPFILLNKDKKEAYMRFTEALKSPEVQKMIVDQTSRRSIDAKITKENSKFDMTQMLIEMPFVPNADLSEALLSAYFNKFKKPAAITFVLDTSGSMAGGREYEMKAAINSITVNVSNNAKYAAIREKEMVFVAPFSSDLYDFRQVNGKNKDEIRSNFANYVSQLSMQGGTALFRSTGMAYQEMVKRSEKDKDYAYSVVVLTDGAANDDVSEFKKYFNKDASVKVYTILFGDANPEQLKVMSDMTKGKVFDGRAGLEKIFKEIRSYQ